MTLLHLVRHGQVDNPQKIVYGRQRGWRLSDRGRREAEAVARHLGGRPIARVYTSPLERAVQTATGANYVSIPFCTASTPAFIGKAVNGCSIDRASEVKSKSYAAYGQLTWNATDALLPFDRKLSPSMPEARDLVRRARQLLPSIGDVEPEAVRIAIRPIPGDHLSAIGPVPRTSGYYLAVTHSGVTMSPFLGAAVADEVVRGKERRELADFRPARFFN